MTSQETNVEDLFRRAQAYHLQRQFAKAGRLYIEILKKNPYHADSLHLLGTALAQDGQQKQAVNYINRAINLKPMQVQYRVNLGVILQDLGQYDKAKASYESAIKIDDQYAEAYYNLAKLYKQMELPEATLLTYDYLLSFSPKRQDALINMGNIFSDQGLFGQAIKCFQTAIHVDSENSDLNSRALINLANTYRRRGDAEEAIRHYGIVLDTQNYDGLLM